MNIMSIESIEIPDHDPNDDDNISKSALFVEKSYKERIDHFKTNYYNSDLRRSNDLIAGYPEIT